jgi:hypothetical protein
VDEFEKFEKTVEKIEDEVEDWTNDIVVADVVDKFGQWRKEIEDSEFLQRMRRPFGMHWMWCWPSMPHKQMVTNTGPGPRYMATVSIPRLATDRA